MVSEFEMIMGDLKGKIFFLEWFDKTLTYTNMFKDSFGFTYAIPGMRRLGYLEADEFWANALTNVLALKAIVQEVAFDPGYDPEFDVFGVSAENVWIVLDKYLAVCEFECMFHIREPEVIEW